MGLVRQPKGKAKRPLGPRKEIEALARKLAAQVVKRQLERGMSKPTAPAVEFDDVTGWADVPRQTTPSGKVRRRFM